MQNAIKNATAATARGGNACFIGENAIDKFSALFT